jgi:hypothetical protein
LSETYGGDVEAMAKDVLVVASALVWYSSRFRHRLPDDQRLTLMIGYHVLALARFSQREVWAGGEPVSRNTLSPGGPPRREIGEFLRSRLGVYFVKLVEGVEADLIAREKAKAAKLQAARDTLAAPFIVADHAAHAD